jgi:hypothetical protein
MLIVLKIVWDLSSTATKKSGKTFGEIVPLLKRRAIRLAQNVMKIYTLLTSALYWFKWSPSCFCRFAFGEICPDALKRERWVKHRACLGVVPKRKSLSPKDCTSTPKQATLVTGLSRHKLITYATSFVLYSTGFMLFSVKNIFLRNGDVNDYL